MSQPRAINPPEHHGRKRQRITSIQEPATNDQRSSSGSDSDAYSEAEIQQSHEVDPDDHEDTSSSGSSGSEDSSATDQTADPVHKTQTTGKAPSSNIHNRLTSFFSQLAEQRANPETTKDEIIEEGSSDSGYEDDEEGKQYVELDLALGVLSEDLDGRDAEDVRIPASREQEHYLLQSDDEDSQQGDGSVLQALQSVADHGNGTRAKVKKRKVEEVS